MINRILAINPGSTSTKIAVFENEKNVFLKNIKHSAEELKPFNNITDQYEFRKETILRELKEAVVNEKVPFEIALQVATSNPADILQLAGKGYVKVGYDADLVLLDSDFNILRVMANGRLVL